MGKKFEIVFMNDLNGISSDVEFNQFGAFLKQTLTMVVVRGGKRGQAIARNVTEIRKVFFL